MIAFLASLLLHPLATHLFAGVGGWLLHLAWRRLIRPHLLGILASFGEGLLKAILSRIV